MSAIKYLYRNLEGYAREHNGEFPAIIELSEERFYDILHEVHEKYPGMEPTLSVARKIFGIPIRVVREFTLERTAFQTQLQEIQGHFQAEYNVQGSMTQRSTRFGYNSLVGNPIRPQIFPYKTHPPYPLIGIEWEPQLTLLNYPKRKVYVRRKTTSDGKVELLDYCKDIVGLKLPLKYGSNIDQDNLEFRTNPVKFQDLKGEIERVQNEMEDLVKVIAKEVGPTGIFLPGHPCTKHVNISGTPFAGSSERKECKFGERIHVRVPYSYNDYTSMKSWKVFRDIIYSHYNEPILLGYSMTGGTYVRRSDLI